MEQAVAMERKSEVEAGSRFQCVRCGQVLHQGWIFAFKARAPHGYADVGAEIPEIRKCISCAFRHLPMLRRSVIVASVVGTIITLFNQGDAILVGHWETALYWKIPISYCVPFCVAMYSALANSRR